MTRNLLCKLHSYIRIFDCFVSVYFCIKSIKSLANTLLGWILMVGNGDLHIPVQKMAKQNPYMRAAV